MAPILLDTVLSITSPPSTAKNTQRRTGYTLLDHSLVSDDYETLAFDAAASLQVQPAAALTRDAKPNDLLISSTYNSPTHLLDLGTLETPYRLLALALTLMKPIRDDYATAPYVDSFNWVDVFQRLQELTDAEEYHWKKEQFYVVIFRSRLRPGADSNRLGELDSHSHEEATTSGGLLKYWFGKPNADRRNLATCLWRGPRDARAGGTGPWHKEARAAAKEMYEGIDFSLHRLVIEEKVTDWKLEAWDQKVWEQNA